MPDTLAECWSKREAAEARVVELERYLTAGREEWLLTSKALEQAEAEFSDLRCCGNCSHYSFNGENEDVYSFCREIDDGDPGAHDKGLYCDVAPHDRCHFTPSRWTSREEAGDE